MSAKTYDKKTAAFIGFLVQNIPADLTDEIMQGWMKNPGAMKRFLSGLNPSEITASKKPVEPKKLLERLSPISIPTIPQFIVAEKLRVSETVDGIKVDWLGENLKKHFLSKREDSVAAEELVTNNLLDGSKDPAIITALGGEEKVEVSFGQFWEFLKTADQNLWYVAYIRSTDDVLWAVFARWRSGGLHVEAAPPDDPDYWYDGDRFLSR